MPDTRIEEIRTLLPQGMLADWVRLGSRLVRLLRDRNHPAAHEAILSRLLAQARASVVQREERRQRVPQLSYPPELPITARKDDLVAAIRAHQVIVVAGETGSGKTTQIPKMCLEAGLGIEAKIGCTQPRRVAALSISRRIADELNVTWGREVGCKIRFDDRSSAETYIKLMTDGILLAETQNDPLLADYNALIIDEAHERSLNIDFLLGYLKGLLVKRPELKLIITSATIDTEAFSRAFNNAPIIEVSGRLYPVEVTYAPFATDEEEGELTFIDAAVRATEQLHFESGSGDVLIFMPGERDIRETADLLEARFGREAEIIPLFGRLSSGDQQRVFAPCARRKIVIATNIAETSLTIPGIRYVIDSGLARISRYNPRTRTKRLPVEPISQSSANQRKGRSGRVQDGICIRLYSEEDFSARPLYTQPEIQRANLAEVILRMKAFRLGEIETFPFVNPPPPTAVQGGYSLLQELGALDADRNLTSLGRDLARLPIDPTLGRMLLQSQQEHATRELLIIAAGLSIQDPRERPLEHKDAAAAAHKHFVDPQSDFLTLLNIWNAVHDQWETLRTQNQRRKFCKAQFLSYLRMREWQDLHAQLYQALEDLGTVRLNESNAAYDAIHRSILTGLLGHVALRIDRNLYQAAGNRQVAIFPGSALHARMPQRNKTAPAQRSSTARPPSTHQPAWIVAGEIVETSQLFARTVAGIDPLWIAQLAPHLCKTTHHNPHWSVTAGRVLVQEKTTLYGLEVRNQKVAFGHVDAKAATQLFIRSALVEEALLPEPAALLQPRPSGMRGRDTREKDKDPDPAVSTLSHLPAVYAFLKHNRQTRQKIETWQTRVRHHDLVDLDEALVAFYASRIENVSSVAELNRFLREHDPAFLQAKETDLIGAQELAYDATAFPDSVPLGGQPVPVSYVYSPGEEQDGVTIQLGFTLAQSISPALVEWSVPGLREAQIAELLRALPKAIRRELMPFAPKVIEIARELQPASQSLRHDLAQFIHRRYGVAIPHSAWPGDALPQHLRPRIEIVNNERKTLGVGRDLGQLRERLEKIKVEPVVDNPAWAGAAAKFERFGLTTWNFDDLPERIVLSESSSLPIYAWPGLKVEEGTVSVRLFHTQESARTASLEGARLLVELSLQKDLAWLQKDLRALARLGALNPMDSLEELQAAAFENLKRYLLPGEPLPALTKATFAASVEQDRQRLAGLGLQFIERLEAILKLRQEIQRRFGTIPAPTPARTGTLADLKLLTPNATPKPPARTALIVRELEELMPKSFLRTIPYERLEHLPRYLNALIKRGDRAALNPAKDQERARQVAPFQEAYKQLAAVPARSLAARMRLEEFRWLIEEFKVSLFAQELGTALPISAKRLNEQLELIRNSA